VLVQFAVFSDHECSDCMGVLARQKQVLSILSNSEIAESFASEEIFTKLVFLLETLFGQLEADD